MKLAPSLHRVGSDMVNVYLIEDDTGVTVVDTGLSGHWKEFVAELSTMGRSIDDVRGVILTHGDTDHVGFAERLRREAAVPIYVHEGDAAQARGEVKKKNPSWGRVRVGPLLGFLWYAVRQGGMSVTPIQEVETVEDGDVLDLPGSPRIIHTPGHSPGSIAIHSPGVEAIFTGDAMTTRHVLTGEEGPQPAPFTLDVDTALRSLEKWRGIEARWVLPGHGFPWDGGVDEAVNRVLARASA